MAPEEVERRHDRSRRHAQRPPPDPLDRPWVHPTELARSSRTRRAPRARPREWVIGLGSALAGGRRRRCSCSVAFGALGGRHRSRRSHRRSVTTPSAIVATRRRTGAARGGTERRHRADRRRRRRTGRRRASCVRSDRSSRPRTSWRAPTGSRSSRTTGDAVRPPRSWVPIPRPTSRSLDGDGRRPAIRERSARRVPSRSASGGGGRAGPGRPLTVGSTSVVATATRRSSGHRIDVAGSDRDRHHGRPRRAPAGARRPDGQRRRDPRRRRRIRPRRARRSRSTIGPRRRGPARRRAGRSRTAGSGVRCTRTTRTASRAAHRSTVVMAGSPAATAGLAPGDVVTRGGRPVDQRSPPTSWPAVRQPGPRTRSTLHVRPRRPHPSTSVTLGADRPAAARRLAPRWVAG